MQIRPFGFQNTKEKAVIIIAEQEKNWIITDGERFIYQNYKGRYVYANGESMAEQFTKAQAENILKHSLPKNLRNTFHVERVRDKNAVLKPITTEDFHNGFEKVMDKDYTQEWLQKLESLNGMMDEAKERKSLLLDNLSRIDMALDALDHYIEDAKLNACQGWYYFNMRRNGRIKRRSIKNELMVIDIVLQSNIGKKTCEEVKRKISGMDKRKYTPKELADLFDFET